MEHYERLDKIGEGTSGVVYKARDRRTGETVAIKRLRPGAGNGEGDAFDETFRREVRCLEACRGHPCLVELRAAHHDPSGGGGAGAFLVMEYAGRTLSEVLQQDHRAERRPFPEAEARRVMRRLLEGVAAMHARGLLHRDLKPDNVLLDGRGGVKICDFGAVTRSGRRYRRRAVHAGGGDAVVPRAGGDPGVRGLRRGRRHVGARLHHGRAPRRRRAAVPREVGDGMQDMASWPGFARLPRAGSPLCHRGRPPSRLRELFPVLSTAGFDVLAGLLACRPDRRLTAADALRCPWFADAAAAAPEALPDQPRASCCAAGFAAGVAGVAEGIVA